VPTITTIRTERPSRIARANSWFFDTFDGVIDRRLRPVKTELFRDIPATVIEIGAGTGANLRYYPAGTTVIAVEPSEAMHDRLRRRADRHGIDLRIETAPATRLPFADASADLLVSTLVLCTVDDPDAAIAEIHRVLRPGGKFVFLEHVVAPRRGLVRAVQRLTRRPWSWLFDGCDTCRDTEAALRRVGWGRVTIGHRRLFDPAFLPISAQIHGSVTR
jgi:ubiquinone/menaquinone biosynthesis C-methylase UbiE